MNRKDLKPRERLLLEGLKDRWIAAATLSELARGTDEFLSPLISADCMTLCMSIPGPQGRYDWQPMNMSMEFFERCPEWEGEDFLRRGVMLNPGIVMRDTDLISPEALQRNAMYRISRELGMPLSHAMSVLLPFPGMEGHGGFTAYRSSRVPFTERERRLVQHVAHLLALTLQKCRRFMEGDLFARLFGAVVQDTGLALLVLAPPDGIITKTDAVPSVVGRWFEPSECTESGLPKELLGKWSSRANRMDTGTWERSRGEDCLNVTFTRLPRLDGPAYWLLTFKEGWRPLSEAVLRTLTPMEARVLQLLMQGKSNKEIATAVGSAPETVKKHLGSIYRKTDIHQRAQFVARAPRKRPGRP